MYDSGWKVLTGKSRVTGGVKLILYTELLVELN